jgi:hypothetical protein
MESDKFRSSEVALGQEVLDYRHRFGIERLGQVVLPISKSLLVFR